MLLMILKNNYKWYTGYCSSSVICKRERTL